MGIKTGKFQTKPGERAEKRRELGYREEDFLILTVAEMTPNKNHITVLKALAEMKDREEFEHIHYLICGRGEMWESLEKSAKELGISEHVRFLGYRDDAPALYQSCDLFAFMTFREGLSVALMEAMSSAMPIVCTKIRGNTDLIDDGISGILTDNNEKALAENVLKLYHDPERRRALGQGAEKKAALFDEKNVHRQMKEIYLQVSN